MCVCVCVGGGGGWVGKLGPLRRTPIFTIVLGVGKTYVCNEYDVKIDIKKEGRRKNMFIE